MEPPPSRDAARLAVLLLAAGCLFALLALAADPALVARFHFRLPLSSEARLETVRSRALFGLAAAALLGLGTFLRLRRPGLTPSATRAFLAALALLLPLLALERGARPFVERLTTLFQADPVLGWRHRPGAADTFWGEQAYINAQGQRGPKRARPKDPGVWRALVLGDSVAFGLLLGEGETFPLQLERELAASTSVPVEVLNAGVSGWATRQERLYLEQEGEGWQPDLVLLLFVLNDVTERPSGLAQLAYTRPPGFPAWLANSGLYLALHELALRRALAGDTPEARAHRDRLTPYHLLLQPDAPPVQAAWAALWPELEGLQDWCRARTLPLALVVVPHALQVREPGPPVPQQALAEFAGRRELELLDLLPAFLAQGPTAWSELYLDGIHPSARGAALAAAETARFLRARGLAP